MVSSIVLAIGLSLFFVIGLIAFVGELYYHLWFKKKREDTENQHSSSSSSSFSKCTLTHLFCFKNLIPSRTPKAHKQDLHNLVEGDEDQEKEQEPTEKDSNLKGFGEESVDLELMRLHNLSGPPRFLFTINEETKEDLETESRKGGSRMSLSELLCIPETPNSSSSPLRTTQATNVEGYLNPLFDYYYYEANEFDINKIRSSPPPTFKFLRDAEEKFLKRLMQLEGEKRACLKKNQDVDSLMKEEEKDGCGTKLGNDKGKSEGRIHHQYHQMSTPSQVLPLASSPSNLRIA